MTHVLDWMPCAVLLALLGRATLVLVVRAVIHRGKHQTKPQPVYCVRRRRSGRSMVIPPPRDQPVAFMPRGGWL